MIRGMWPYAAASGRRSLSRSDWPSRCRSSTTSPGPSSPCSAASDSSSTPTSRARPCSGSVPTSPRDQALQMLVAMVNSDPAPGHRPRGGPRPDRDDLGRRLGAASQPDHGRPPRARRRAGIIGSFRGCSSMAEHQLPKLTVRVRFSSPARRTTAPTLFGGLCHARRSPPRIGRSEATDLVTRSQDNGPHALDQLDLHPAKVRRALVSRMTEETRPPLTMGKLLGRLSRAGVPAFAEEARRHDFV
jgi:hypothetical protein